MGVKVKYVNKQEQEREFEFDDDVEEIKLAGENPGEGYALIGSRNDGENEVVNGVYDVLNEEVIDDEVPRTSDGTSVALKHL